MASFVHDSLRQLQRLLSLVGHLDYQLRRHDSRRDRISKIVAEDAEDHLLRPIDALDKLREGFASSRAMMFRGLAQMIAQRSVAAIRPPARRVERSSPSREDCLEM